jgi:hypothetical protein
MQISVRGELVLLNEHFSINTISVGTVAFLILCIDGVVVKGN